MCSRLRLPLRPVASLALLLGLLLSALATHAGTYVWTTTDPSTGLVTGRSPVYSGGTLTTTPGGTIYQFARSWYDGSYGGSASGSAFSDAQGNAGSGTLTASGLLTAKFTWRPAYPGEPAPVNVIVQQDCSAHAHLSYGQGGPPVLTCTSSDGLGGSKSGTTDANSTSTKYTVETPAADGTVSVTCSPSVVYHANSGSGTGGNVSWVALGVGISYTATAYPITVSLGGTIKDSSGALNVLTGGQVTATLNGIPSGFTVTNYSWSVAGATAPNPFWTWDPTFPNSSYPTQFVPLRSTDMTRDSFSFYDAHGGDSVTVQCTATVQPPSGPALTVTATSLKIKYVKPTVSWVTNQSFGGHSFGFHDDPMGQDFYAQELWGPIKITEPPLFYTASNPNSTGFGVIVQIANLNRSSTRAPLNGRPATYSKLSVLYANGTTGALLSPVGLDIAFPYPYGYYINPDGTFTNISGNYGWLAYNVGYCGDSPTQTYINRDQDGGGNGWNAASASDSYSTWVMYRPASVGGQGTIYVPLQTLTWSWGATAIPNQFNLWGATQTQPFTSGPPTSTDTYPSWGMSIPFPLNLGP